MTARDNDRLRRNAESKAMAENDGMPWTADDLAFLLEFFSDAHGDVTAEREVAEALGRTIEACRQRYYTAKSGCGPSSVVIVQTTTTTTTTKTTAAYIGAMDEDDDQWWSPSHYTRNTDQER